MSGENVPEIVSNQDTDRPIRFGIRHLLYLITFFGIVMGIPGGLYVVGVIVAPWVWFLFIIGPLILVQFLVVLAVPPLRRKLLGRRPRPRGASATTPATDA
jgi:hypothetical protein